MTELTTIYWDIDSENAYSQYCLYADAQAVTYIQASRFKWCDRDSVVQYYAQVLEEEVLDEISLQIRQNLWFTYGSPGIFHCARDMLLLEVATYRFFFL